ncbi:MAG: hypothetical protein KatS3mg110_0458 [Pirellulaceae bacterium]|nr:MAG: hypothetical protein KatS3mg110_0458 [Pirellulaceae bacterium]
MNERFDRKRRFRNMLRAESPDPLASLANLFDVAMVFSVALVLALIGHLPAEMFLTYPATAHVSGSIRTSRESPPERGYELKRFFLGDREAQGQGRRLGTAYQLPSGTVICVPEHDARPHAGQ